MNYHDVVRARDDAQRRVKDLELALHMARERLKAAEQRAATAEANARIAWKVATVR